MRQVKPTLRYGSKGPAVKELQMLLNAQSSTQPKITADSDFGNKTFAAVKAFQKHKRLKMDGVVGKNTWPALANPDLAATLYKYPPGPQESLSDIAVPYIGATEAKGNKMGADKRMKEIFESDKYAPNNATDGYPWCAAFVSMCVQKLINKSPYYGNITKPYTPSAYNFRTVWAKNQNCLIFSPNNKVYSPHKGDIVIFTFSHIGIVEKITNAQVVQTIEGNTNKAGSREGTSVERKSRNTQIISYFIRLPILKAYDFERQICAMPQPSKREYSLEDFLGSLFATPEN